MTDVPNIDKIYEEGREPTEEEWIAWAKSFKPKSLTERKPEHEARLKKKKAKQALRDRARKKREYANRKETGHKSWGEKYNTKRRYLAQYNEEYRKRLAYQTALREYKKSRLIYDSWVNSYRKYYKNKLGEKASTFKIGENKYVLGFTNGQLRGLSPFNHVIYNYYRNNDIIPPPKYTGFRFKNNKVSTKKEPFYLLTEVEAYCSFFDKNKKRMNTEFTTNDTVKAFCKKAIWEGMLEARRIFDEENGL